MRFASAAAASTVLLIVAPSSAGNLAGSAVADPVITNVKPRLVAPSGLMTVQGSNLTPHGYIVAIEYRARYQLTGTTARSALAPDVVSPTSIQFTAPANARPDSMTLVYAPDRQARSRAALTRTRFPLGPTFVRESPILLNSVRTVTLNGVTRSVLRLGTDTIRGRHLLPPSPGTTSSITPTTVRFSATSGTSALTVSAMRINPAVPLPDGSQGEDELIVQVPQMTAPRLGTLEVVAHGGTALLANTFLLAPPRVTRVDEIVGVATRFVSDHRLTRGRTYRLTGSGFELSDGGTSWHRATVKLGALVLPVDDVTSGSIRLTIPATAATGALTVQTVAGTANAGSFTVVDPAATLPLADAIITPNPVTGAVDLTSTVSFSGSIPPGTSMGELEIAGDQTLFRDLPKIVPITSNPLTVRLESRAHETDTVGAIVLRLAQPSGGRDTLIRSVQMRAVEPTSISVPASVQGGQNVTATLQFNGKNLGCTVVFGTTLAGLEARLSSSNPAAAQFQRSRVCMTSLTEQVTVTTAPVATATPVTLTVRIGAVSRSATLTVEPPSLTSVTVDRAQLTSMQAATGTLTLSSPVSGAAALLSSSDPAVSVPAKLTFGSSATVTFPITTAPVATSRSVTISALVNGVTRTATLTLHPLQVAAVTFSPTSVPAGNTSAGTVRLSAPINLPVTVTLASSDTSVVTVPASVSFVAGQDVAIFAVQTRAPQSQPRNVTITATYSQATPSSGTVSTSGSGSLSVQP